MAEGQRVIAYRVSDTSGMDIEPAPRSRAWMDATTERFAQRCLPMVIANQAGWVIRNPRTVHATWTGGADRSTLTVAYRDEPGPLAAASHFGHGILTWTIPYLFRTPPGVQLLVRGPSNWPKDGAAALEGIVETDWAVATFTMNWVLTRPLTTVTWERGEPICMLVPTRISDLEQLVPTVAEIDTDPELSEHLDAWKASRSDFLATLHARATPPSGFTWQRHYFQGSSPSGLRAPDHRLRVRMQPFGPRSEAAALRKTIEQILREPS